MRLPIPGVPDRVKRAVVGPNPSKLPRRIGTLVLVVSLGLAIAGAFTISRAGLESAGTSSLPILRPALQLATSTWTYVAVVAVVSWRVLKRRDVKMAQQAASVTGFSLDTVKRLSWEAKSPDGSTRVIATTDDEPEEIRSRILEALETGEDDTMSLNPDAFEEPSTDDVAATTERKAELLEELDDLQERADEISDELDSGLSDVLEADFSPGKMLGASLSDEDRVAPADLLADEDQERLDGLDGLQAELEENIERQEEILETLDRLDAATTSNDLPVPADRDVLELERNEVPRWRRLLGRVRARLATPVKVAVAAIAAAVIWELVRLVGLMLPGPGVADVAPGIAGSLWEPLGYAGVAFAGALVVLSEVVSRRRERERRDVAEDREGSPDPWLESYKVARLDLASTLDLDELIWTVAVPAGLTIVSILIVVQLWVQPWLYIPIAALGLLVGLLNLLRVQWVRSRRLEEVRAEHEGVRWDDVAVLVKEVETAETPMYYAWMGTRRYAHEDRTEFASEVGTRAYELVNGVSPSPSILEKQANQLEEMHPDLHAYRDDERERIMTHLLEEVSASREGLLPKQKLIEDTIEYNVDTRGLVGAGKGYDPALVRKAYRDLVPAALVEQEVETAEGTLTAVRHRRDPLPPEYGAIRAQFSSQFAGYAKWEPLYELPDVSDLLEAEPHFASTVGYREGA